MKNIFVLTVAFLLFTEIISQNLKDSQFKIQYAQTGLTHSLRGNNSLNEKITWVSGPSGTYAKTEDGGKTWKVKKVEGADSLDFRDVQIINENIILLMSVGNGESSKIFKSIDGGKSGEIKLVNTEPKGFFNGIAFWDSQNGILVGDPIDRKLFIMTTSDAGETWQRVNPKNIPSMFEGEYGYAASGTNVAVKGESNAWIGTGGPKARVFYTKDKGKTWQVSETPIRSGNSTSGIFSLAFKDELTGIAVGGNYLEPESHGKNVIVTNDGGKTWELAESSGDVVFQSCVVFADQIKDGLVLSTGPSGTYFSEDDGMNWQLLSRDGFHAISIGENGTMFWTSGSEGRVAQIELHSN